MKKTIKNVFCSFFKFFREIPCFPWLKSSVVYSLSYKEILQPILDEPDRKKAFFDLVDVYIKGDDDFRKTVCECWDFGVRWKYCDPSRMASTTEDGIPPLQKIRADMICHALCIKDSLDFRDDLMSISVDYHSCVAAGLDPDEIFRSIAAISPPKLSKLLIGFVERAPVDRSMKAFGLRKLVHEDGTIELQQVSFLEWHLLDESE